MLCDWRVKVTYHNMQKTGFTASSHVQTEAVAGRNALMYPEVTGVCSWSKKVSGDAQMSTPEGTAVQQQLPATDAQSHDM